MVITKVSLVDEGSCSEAHITLMKRKENTTMTYEEIMKGLPADKKAVIEAMMADKDAAIAKAAADLAAAEEDKTKLAKEAEDAKKEADEAKKAMEDGKDDEDEEEQLFKSASPAMQAFITKMKEQKKAAESLAKQALEAEVTKEAIAKAKSLANIPVKEDEVVSLYKSLNGVNKELATQVFDVLEKAHAVIEKGAAFTETGSAAPGAGAAGDNEAAWAAIEKAAEPIAKSRNISKEAAVSAVIAEQPSLYQNYLKTLE